MNERAQIECVFRLSGGELNDRPWVVCGADGPGRDLRLHAGEIEFQYHYEGAPDYSESDFAGYDTLRTVVTCELFGRKPDWLLEHDGSVWHRVGSFYVSGEAQCLGSLEVDDSDESAVVTSEHVGTGDRCVLCDESLGEPHGFVYLGDGWAEVVYALVEGA